MVHSPLSLPILYIFVYSLKSIHLATPRWACQFEIHEHFISLWTMYVLYLHDLTGDNYIWELHLLSFYHLFPSHSLVGAKNNFRTTKVQYGLTPLAPRSHEVSNQKVTKCSLEPYVLLGSFSLSLNTGKQFSPII